MKNKIAIPPHLGGHKDFSHADQGALDYLIKEFDIKSMIDIGCGPNLEANGIVSMIDLATDRGLKAVGVDGDVNVACGKVLIHDYTIKPLNFDGIVDLAWSIEFAEHVKHEYVDNFMPSFALAKYVVLTAAPPRKRGYHHVNCRKQSYWKDKFKEYGFKFSDHYTEEIKQASTMLMKKNREGFIKKRGMFFINETI